MPNPTTHDTKNKGKGSPKPNRPFTRASFEHLEPAFDVSQLIGANAVQLGPFDVPAYGFVRNIWVLVEGTLGVLGAGVLHEDYPGIVFSEVSLMDVNGGFIYGPTDGFDAFLVNKYGGYAFASNPASPPDYVGTINTSFAFRIPVEISHKTGHGSLANMNAAATYKVRLTVNSSANAYSTAPTTPATLRIRGYLEAWALPQPTTRNGRPQRTRPPGHGTTQYWSKYTRNTVVGENTLQLTRVGNRIRTLIVIHRTGGTPTRNDTNYADPLRVVKDSRNVLNEPVKYRRTLMYERYGYARETGVYVYDLSRGNDVAHPGGDDDGHLWLRTKQSTRLEIVGSFGATGVVTFLTNDVAAPLPNQNRYEAESMTGGPGSSAHDGD